MRVIFTCGGTAGHINPAIALAGLLRQRQSGTEILFVGARGGMESRLVPKAGYDFRGVDISSFYRSLSPSAVKHNAVSVLNLLRSPAEAREILQEFRPDLVVGTGGYASYPMVRCAAKNGIPTAVHESNAVPGLTTRKLEKLADRVMVGFEACRQYYRCPDKVVVTGTPVRGDFFTLTREQARAKLGLADERPLLLSFWGSLGASVMNRHTVDLLRLESEKRPFYHIHAAGRAGFPEMQRQLREAGVELARCPELDLREYIYDMAVVMRAADLVICRAGASTISELTALAVPAIIVPSPYVVNNHQEKNARILQQAGAAVLLREEECSGQRLYEEAGRILQSPETRAAMGAAMGKLGVPDAADRIYDTVMALCR